MNNAQQTARRGWEQFFEDAPGLFLAAVFLIGFTAFALWIAWNALWPYAPLTFARAIQAASGGWCLLSVASGVFATFLDSLSIRITSVERKP